MKAATTRQISPGSLLAHYRIEEVIGEGTTGVVYRARDTSLETDVAVKVLRPDISADGSSIPRFIQECRSIGRIRHPHLARILYAGSEGKRIYYAMELATGPTVEQLVEDWGPLPVPVALEVLYQIALALQEAHGAGVIHRDVKPGNVLIGSDRLCKVIDFGLARSMNAPLNATPLGQILGTPAFMSPEQCRAQPVSFATDVYSLGVTAWHALEGKLPFDGTGIAEVIDGHLSQPLPSLSIDAPEWVPELLGQMCEKDPNQRPSIDVVVEEIRIRRSAQGSTRARPRERFAAGFADLAAWSVPALTLAATGILTAGQAAMWGGLAFLLVGRIGLETWFATTVGKWPMDLRVKLPGGRRPGLWRSAVRNLAGWPGAVAGMAVTLSLLLGGQLHALEAVMLGVVLTTFCCLSHLSAATERWTQARVHKRISRECAAIVFDSQPFPQWLLEPKRVASVLRPYPSTVAKTRCE